MTNDNDARGALTSESLEKALRRAFNLGQTYWQQADSESYSQNKKADTTAQTFSDHVAETVARFTAPSLPAGDGLTDEQIVSHGYAHTVYGDEPLFTFDRPALLSFARSLAAPRQLGEMGAGVQTVAVGTCLGSVPRGWDKIEADEQNQIALDARANIDPRTPNCDCLMPNGAHTRQCPVYKWRRAQSLADSKRLYSKLDAASAQQEMGAGVPDGDSPFCQSCGSAECPRHGCIAEPVAIPRAMTERVLRAMAGWREIDANEELRGEAQMLERIYSAIVREFNAPRQPTGSTWDDEFEREWQRIGVGGDPVKHHCERFYMAAISRKDFLESLERSFPTTSAQQDERRHAAPNGWVMVPVSPTEEMLRAPDIGKLLPASGGETQKRWDRRERDWAAMLSSLPAAPGSDPTKTEAQQDEREADYPRFTLTGAQLLEALEFIAPDYPRDAEQLESEVTIQYGEGHSGKGYYCWVTDYPEEGAILLDGASVPQQVQADAGAVAYIPDDALARLTPPLLVLDGVRLYRYNGVGTTALYTHPAAESDKRDAERWRTVTRFVSAWLSGGRRQVWSLEALPIPAGVNLMKGSVAQHFADAVDRAAMSREQSGGGE